MGSFFRMFFQHTVFVCAISATLFHCNNDESLRGPSGPEAWVCEDKGRPALADNVCPAGQRFAQGTCIPARCDAGPWQNNCCPGTFCDPGGVCQVAAAKLTFCSKDSECTKGQVCLERAHIDARKICGFPSPDSNGACAENTQLFNHRCVGSTPCGGSCASGQVCNIDTNKCEPSPSAAAGADNTCSQTCPQGSLLVFSQPDTMLFNQCCALSCVCEPVPGIAVGRVGAYADVLIQNDTLLMSSYDPTYGDLTLSSYNLQNFSRTTTAYIDGFPTSGTPSANPSGPRKGLSEPGPNVGRYTAMASFNKALYITYYDVDQKQLKIAVQTNPQAPWKTSVIDNQPGDVGRYASVAVDTRGMVHVAYLAQRAGDASFPHTGPYYARSKSTVFNGPQDWEISAVETVTACPEACGSNETCVSVQGESTCLPKASACTSGCACDSACVTHQGRSFCAPSMPNTLPPLADTSSANMPQSTGLFTQMLLHNNTPTVVYYDRLRTHLRVGVAQFASDGAVSNGFASFPLVCVPDVDTGQHAHAGISASGTLGVAFAAFEGQELWYYEGSSWTDGSYETIDTGERSNAVHRVGGGIDMGFSSTQEPVIAYADQTTNDLYMARKVDGTWTKQLIAEEGALGAFPTVLQHKETVVLGTYQRLFSNKGDLSTYRFYTTNNTR